MKHDQTVEKNGRTYVHDLGNPGYYGVVVDPGSPDDNTMGKVGIHWEYLQYSSTPEAEEIRRILSEFYALEDAEEKQKEARRIHQFEADEQRAKELKEMGLCPKCGTFCCGDCET